MSIAAPHRRHNWYIVGGPPDEPMDSNMYYACDCGKTKAYPCGALAVPGEYSLMCAKPIDHFGNHRGNGYEWLNRDEPR
jgi:hypothetical protein